jgi:adhesin transport system membrane fusion protein
MSSVEPQPVPPKSSSVESRPHLVFIGAGARYDVAVEHVPAMRLIRPPASVRRVALALALLFPLLLLALLFVPWQQTALGTGRVIALSPADRSQAVDAPVKGRIAQWAVSEGDAVEEGDLLVVLEDNDPDYSARLEAQRGQVEAGLEAARQQVETYRLKVAAETTARDLAVAEYEAKILSERQKLSGEIAEADTARLQTERVSVLTAEGIESTRKLELAMMKQAKADAAVQARLMVIEGLRSAQTKADRAGDSKVASAEAAYQGAVAKEAEARSKLLDIDTKLARQARQMVLAPRAGRVLRLHGGPGGAQVKEGDVLVTLVPDTLSRAVELKVDGNDMPLIAQGEEVSILFEGWPALQFSGWPELNSGTFSGVVSFTDATDDGSGKFRVVVVPHPEAGDWPDGSRLRQGVRVKGFVMLSRVRLGYELWRQINGFPPLPPVDKTGGGLPATGKKPRASKVLK